MEDIWMCTNCEGLQGKHDLKFEGDTCEKCNDLNRPIAKGIHVHYFRIIPKSGAKHGIAYWKCIGCNKVVQST